MRRPARRKARPKKEARKSGYATAAKGAAFANLIAAAPRLNDPDVARVRVSDWLAGVSSADSEPLKSLFSTKPVLGTRVEPLAETPPDPSDLITREPDRLRPLL